MNFKHCGIILFLIFVRTSEAGNNLSLAKYKISFAKSSCNIESQHITGSGSYTFNTQPTMGLVSNTGTPQIRTLLNTKALYWKPAGGGYMYSYPSWENSTVSAVPIISTEASIGSLASSCVQVNGMLTGCSELGPTVVNINPVSGLITTSIPRRMDKGDVVTLQDLAYQWNYPAEVSISTVTVPSITSIVNVLAKNEMQWDRAGVATAVVKGRCELIYELQTEIAIQALPNHIDCGVFGGTETQLCRNSFTILQSDGAALPPGRLTMNAGSLLPGVTNIAAMGDAGLIEVLYNGNAVPLNGDLFESSRSPRFIPRITSTGKGNGAESLSLNITFTAD